MLQITVTLTPETRAAIDAIEDAIEETGQSERFWAAIDAIELPRAIPRVLPPGEPCQCDLCQRVRALATS